MIASRLVSDSVTPSLWHLLVVALVGAVFVAFRERDARWERPWLLTLVAASCALLPLFSWLLPKDYALVAFGKEGFTEGITAGLLLGVTIAAIREKAWWVVLPALVFWGEELDWGFVVLGNSPAPPVWLESRSGTFNFHNTPYLYWFWKPVPMLAAIALGLRPWPSGLETLAERASVPRLSRHVVWGVPLAVALFAVTKRLVGERLADEAWELALIAVVASAWQKTVPEPVSAVDAPSRRRRAKRRREREA